MLNNELTSFFEVEIRNEDTMRREYDYDADTYEEDSDIFIPESNLGTAHDSWIQAPADVLAAWCGISDNLHEEVPADVQARLDEVHAELMRLIEVHGENCTLEELLAADAEQPDDGNEFMDVDAAIFHAAEDGKKEAYDEIRSLMSEPSTDDPIDLLREIAALIGSEDDYDYFDDRGEWVLYPNHNN